MTEIQRYEIKEGFEKIINNIKENGDIDNNYKFDLESFIENSLKRIFKENNMTPVDAVDFSEEEIKNWNMANYIYYVLREKLHKTDGKRVSDEQLLDMFLTEGTTKANNNYLSTRYDIEGFDYVGTGDGYLKNDRDIVDFGLILSGMFDEISKKNCYKKVLYELGHIDEQLDDIKNIFMSIDKAGFFDKTISLISTRADEINKNGIISKIKNGGELKELRHRIDSIKKAKNDEKAFFESSIDDAIHWTSRGLYEKINVGYEEDKSKEEKSIKYLSKKCFDYVETNGINVDEVVTTFKGNSNFGSIIKFFKSRGISEEEIYSSFSSSINDYKLTEFISSLPNYIPIDEVNSSFEQYSVDSIVKSKESKSNIGFISNKGLLDITKTVKHEMANQFKQTDEDDFDNYSYIELIKLLDNLKEKTDSNNKHL